MGCKARIGAFNWSGMQCSCGAWVNPAFQLLKSRIDECRIWAEPSLELLWCTELIWWSMWCEVLKIVWCRILFYFYFGTHILVSVWCLHECVTGRIAESQQLSALKSSPHPDPLKNVVNAQACAVGGVVWNIWVVKASGFHPQSLKSQSHPQCDPSIRVLY